jgi:hypothetical protein
MYGTAVEQKGLESAISGFRHDVHQTCVLVRYYAVFSCNSIPTFRARYRSETSVKGYQSTVRNIPEECRSQVQSGSVLITPEPFVCVVPQATVQGAGVPVARMDCMLGALALLMFT